ncbi:MAG TPA: HNH endonuclease [Nitrososphaeraceae archaeon]|nr:HNH endonuclease [Nitrososphaeraceae archaeon]
MRKTTIPLQIQKQLQKETLYGCAICGCPILEYVQMIPNSDTQTFIPENMVSLCPFHHLQYRNGDNLSESSIRDAKNNPYNKTHENDSFIIQSQDMPVSVGKCKFVNTSRVLVIDDFDIVSIKRENGKYLLLDINFFDKLNNLIAIVSDNTWTAEKSSDWSISYKSGSLTIQNQTRKILFEAKIENDSDNKENHITIKTDGMYYNGAHIKITENEISIDNREVAIELKGTVMKNYETGISEGTI